MDPSRAGVGDENWHAENYVDAYIAAAGIAEQKKTPLFRSIGQHRTLTSRPLDARNALHMIKCRARAIGLPETICNHTFRATGITAYRANGGGLEKTQGIANHPSPKTTKLYDRTSDDLEDLNKLIVPL